LRGSPPGDGLLFSVEGRTRENAADDPRARPRSVSPGFFAALGIPLIDGRDFTDEDRNGGERVVIISASIAQQLFPNQNPEPAPDVDGRHHALHRRQHRSATDRRRCAGHR
jgi:hypothetical protein